jgi:hypothetical protein
MNLYRVFSRTVATKLGHTEDAHGLIVLVWSANWSAITSWYGDTGVRRCSGRSYESSPVRTSVGGAKRLWAWSRLPRPPGCSDRSRTASPNAGTTEIENKDLGQMIEILQKESRGSSNGGRS